MPPLEPELAEVALAPALDRPVVEQRAGVGVPGGEGDGRAPRAQVHEGKVVAHLVRVVAVGLDVAEPALAVAVASPAAPHGGQGGGQGRDTGSGQAGKMNARQVC